MDSNFLHQARSKAVENQVQSLTDSIQSLSSRLEKINGLRTSNNYVKDSDWTDVYKKWNDWEDEDEIKTTLQKSKQKLTKLKRNHEKTQRKQIDADPDSICCSSQNREDERKVVKMSTKERLEHMQIFRRDHGNKEYEQGNFSKARKWYDKALIYYEYCFMSSGKEADQVEEERLLCLLNIAACDLALKHYQACIESCIEALAIPRSDTFLTFKALLRRAKAYRLTSEFQKAKLDLEQAKGIIVKLDDQNQSNDLHNEFKLLEKAIGTYDSKSKEFAKRMLRKC